MKIRRIVPCGETDRDDEAHSDFFQLFFSKTLKKVKWSLCVLICVKRLSPTEIRVSLALLYFARNLYRCLFHRCHSRTYKTKVSLQAGTVRISCTNCDLLYWLRFSLFARRNLNKRKFSLPFTAYGFRPLFDRRVLFSTTRADNISPQGSRHPNNTTWRHFRAKGW